jgi:NADPH-dependent ferric siderophore reductase
MTEISIPEAREWSLEVVSVQDLTPGMRRIHLTGPGLEKLDYLPGQDMAIAVTSPQGEPVRRRYTIRAFDPLEGSVDVDFVMHGDGPAARWATTAKAGDAIEVIAPRGKITIARDSTSHLFLGDDSAIPATAAMIESLSPGSTARALLEVQGPQDEIVITPPEGVELSVAWLHRGEARPGESDALMSAVAGGGLDAGAGHAYLAGEFGMVIRLRSMLQDRGFTKEQISPKPYWRTGRDNMAHGEPFRD